MTMTTRKRRIGRKRWGDLIKFLTQTMKTAQSERVRMQAALRLADVLTLREQREQLELRRELREAANRAGEPDEGPGVQEQRVPATETVEEFLERIKAATTKETSTHEQAA